MEESKKYKFEYKTSYKNTAEWLCNLLDEIQAEYNIEYDLKNHQFVFEIDTYNKKTESILIKYSFICMED